MGERLTGNFDQDHVDGFEAMQEDGTAESYSEAVRIAANRGLNELGYKNGVREETWLQWFVGELAKVLSFLALGWIAATIYFPVEFRFMSVYFLAAALGTFGVERVLQRVEPRITHAMTQAIGKKVSKDKA